MCKINLDKCTEYKILTHAYTTTQHILHHVTPFSVINSMIHFISLISGNPLPTHIVMNAESLLPPSITNSLISDLNQPISLLVSTVPQTVLNTVVNSLQTSTQIEFSLLNSFCF